MQAGFRYVLFLENWFSSPLWAFYSHTTLWLHTEMVPSGQCSLFQRGKSAWKFLTPTGNSMPVCWIGKQLGIQNPPSDTGFFQAQVYNSTLIQQHRNSELFRSMTHQKSVIQQYKYDLSSESSPVTYLQDCYEHRQWMSFPRSTAFAQGAQPDSSAVLGRP